MWAGPGLLERRPVLYVFYRTEQHERALVWLITLEQSEGKITATRT
jgi:hypothetical protein